MLRSSWGHEHENTKENRSRSSSKQKVTFDVQKSTPKKSELIRQRAEEASSPDSNGSRVAFPQSPSGGKSKSGDKSDFSTSHPSSSKDRRRSLSAKKLKKERKKSMRRGTLRLNKFWNDSNKKNKKAKGIFKSYKIPKDNALAEEDR